MESGCRSADGRGDGALSAPDPSASARAAADPGRMPSDSKHQQNRRRAQRRRRRRAGASARTSEVGLDVGEDAGGGGVDRGAGARHERRGRRRRRRRRGGGGGGGGGRKLVHGGAYLAVTWERGGQWRGKKGRGGIGVRKEGGSQMRRGRRLRFGIFCLKKKKGMCWIVERWRWRWGKNRGRWIRSVSAVGWSESL